MEVIDEKDPGVRGNRRAASSQLMPGLSTLSQLNKLEDLDLVTFT